MGSHGASGMHALLTREITIRGTGACSTLPTVRLQAIQCKRGLAGMDLYWPLCDGFQGWVRGALMPFY